MDTQTTAQHVPTLTLESLLDLYHDTICAAQLAWTNAHGNPDSPGWQVKQRRVGIVREMILSEYGPRA